MLSFAFLISLWAITGALLGIHAAPPAEVDVLEHLPSVPEGWRQGAAPPAVLRLRCRIAVRQENAYRFEQTVLDISTPNHPKYGKHLKRDELKAMLRPSLRASQSILGWLEAEGVPETDVEDDGDWINFHVSVSDAERILRTKFHYYTSLVNNLERIRTLQYFVPKELHQYIQMIQPTTRFGQMRGERSLVLDHHEVEQSWPTEQNYRAGFGRLANSTFCNTTITPTCLRELYNIGTFKPDPNNGTFILQLQGSCPASYALFRQVPCRS